MATSSARAGRATREGWRRLARTAVGLCCVAWVTTTGVRGQAPEAPERCPAADPARLGLGTATPNQSPPPAAREQPDTRESHERAAPAAAPPVVAVTVGPLAATLAALVVGLSLVVVALLVLLRRKV